MPPKPTCSYLGCQRPCKARGFCNAHYQRERTSGRLAPAVKPALGSRFWSKVDRDGPVPEEVPGRPKGLGPCWLWAGQLNGKGYGRFNHISSLAHRAAWRVANGPIPDGQNVNHHCDNPPCVRPSHLFLGTQADGVADMDRKGRRVNAPSLGEAHGGAKLTEDDVKTIRTVCAKGGVTQARLGRMFGVAKQTIALIINRKTWRHI